MSMVKPATVKDLIALLAAILGVLCMIWTSVTYALEFLDTLARRKEVDDKMERVLKHNQRQLDEREQRDLKRKIFELNLIERPNNVERATKRQYQQELDEVNRRLGGQ